MQRLLGIPLLTAVMLLAVGAVATAAVPKVTLTVVVDGDGGVVSKPAGIGCPSACKLHVRKGARVVLTATPGDGSTFAGWSAPCGKSPACKVTMSKSRSVRASFKTQQTTTIPPPPPPAPVARPGHYAGTYSDGSFISFDVQGASVSNVSFDFNGSCTNGGTMSGPPIKVTGSFPVQSDGSFGGPIKLTFSNASGNVDLAGKLTPTGLGSGTINVSITFNDGTACTSKGTWAAQDQS